MTLAPPRALLVDYGCVISNQQPDEAVAAMAEVAGLELPVFIEHYWAHRLSYDRGDDARTYCVSGARFKMPETAGWPNPSSSTINTRKPVSPCFTLAPAENHNRRPFPAASIESG